MIILLAIWLSWWHCFWTPFRFVNQNYIIDFVSLKVICRKPDVLKLVRCVCVCVWIYFALHSLIVLRQKHSSFVCRLNGHRAELPTTSVVIRTASVPAPWSAGSPQWPTGFRRESAWGETPLHRAARYGHVAAAELLLAKGAAVDAKTNSGRGLNAGSRRQKSSLELGALQNPARMFRVWNSCIFSKCLAKSWFCTPSVGISDHT